MTKVQEQARVFVLGADKVDVVEDQKVQLGQSDQEFVGGVVG
ncbi:hypothetical protein [Desulfonatronum thioautotrophicum]|nr:hypothetical protein [Desulfonatronum thioautotrophicum]